MNHLDKFYDKDNNRYDLSQFWCSKVSEWLFSDFSWRGERTYETTTEKLDFIFKPFELFIWSKNLNNWLFLSTSWLESYKTFFLIFFESILDVFQRTWFIVLKDFFIIKGLHIPLYHVVKLLKGTCFISVVMVSRQSWNVNKACPIAFNFRTHQRYIEGYHTRTHARAADNNFIAFFQLNDLTILHELNNFLEICFWVKRILKVVWISQ